MANKPSLDDYVDVAERIREFKDLYPNGTLQTEDYHVREVGRTDLRRLPRRCLP